MHLICLNNTATQKIYEIGSYYFKNINVIIIFIYLKRNFLKGTRLKHINQRLNDICVFIPRS